MKIINLHDIHNRFEVLEKTLHRIEEDYRGENMKPILTFCGDFLNSPEDKHNGKLILEIMRDMIWEMEDKGFQTIVTPGNHDVGSNGIFYSKSDHERFYSIFQLQKDQINYIEQEGIYIIAIDSTADSDTTFMAAGKIGEEQLQELEQLCIRIGKEVPKIVIMHHHPIKRASHLDSKGMELVDAEQYRAIARQNNVILTLHGHRHSYQGLYDGRGILTFTSGRMRNDLKYSVVEIRNQEEVWASYWR